MAAAEKAANFHHPRRQAVTPYAPEVSAD